MGVEVKHQSFLTWGLHGGGKHRAPAALAPRKNHGIHFKRGWMGARAGPGILEEKPPLPAFEIRPF